MQLDDYHKICQTMLDSNCIRVLLSALGIEERIKSLHKKRIYIFQNSFEPNDIYDYAAIYKMQKFGFIKRIFGNTYGITRDGLIWLEFVTCLKVEIDLANIY